MACPNRVEKPDQDQDVSGHFVDVLDKSRLIVEHSLSMPSVTDSLGITIDRFRLQSLYQVVCPTVTELKTVTETVTAQLKWF